MHLQIPQHRDHLKDARARGCLGCWVAESVSDEEPSMAAQLDDFNCPVCMELLYRPVVNTCGMQLHVCPLVSVVTRSVGAGHSFCFWCQSAALALQWTFMRVLI